MACRLKDVAKLRIRRNLQHDEVYGQIVKWEGLLYEESNKKPKLDLKKLNRSSIHAVVKAGDRVTNISMEILVKHHIAGFSDS